MKSLPPRIVLIDLFRGGSILLVLLWHFSSSRLIVLQSMPSPTITPIWNAFSLVGAYGVPIFFVLSGFLITGVLVKSVFPFELISLQEFYIRRAGRILPLISLICVIGLLVRDLATPTALARFCFSGPIHETGLWASIGTFTFNWYRILFDRSPHNFGLHWSVLWSLSIEEQFYLFYPLLLKRLGAIKKVVVTLSLIMLMGFLWRMGVFLFWNNDYLWSIDSSFGAFDQLASGGLLFFARQWAIRTPNKNQILLVIAPILGASLLIFVFGWTSLPEPRSNVFVPTLIALGVALFLFGGLQIHIPENPFTRALSFPGQLSYGLYLLHSIAIFLFASWATSFHNPWLAFSVFSGLTLGMAFVVFSAFENPINKKIRETFSA